MLGALETNSLQERPRVDEGQSVQLSSLVELVRKDFSRARDAKQKVNDRLQKCIKYFLSQYTDEELAHIRALQGSEVFIPLTNMKVRAGEAWLTDIYFQPNEDIFDIKPTPIPDLPPESNIEIEKELNAQFSDLYQSVAKMLVLSGGTFDVSVIQDIMEKQKEEMKKKYIQMLQEKAKKICNIQKLRIEDQFVEGGFYTAFKKVLHDIMIYPLAIMKGPVLRKQRRFITSAKTVVEVTIPTYNRVSPFDIYPSPNATSFDDGYIIEVLHLTPQQVYELIGVEGFNEANIREALAVYKRGLREQPYGTAERDVLNLTDTSTDDTIDVIEYWNAVEGRFLKDAGINVEDEDAYYNICAWVIGNYLIKAIINPDPLGKKPYVGASFITIPDNFWGMALPEVLYPIQSAVNALARASINNSVLSSGPLIERNKDRLAGSQPPVIAPFAFFDVHESGLNSAPAFRFYQLQPISQQVLFLLQHFQKLADEYSGIPAYAHGDVTVGGAGRTAMGLNSLMLNASRGIKDIVKNIDEGIIVPMVKMQYYYNLYNIIDNPEEIPDLTIDARGSITLMEKQAQTTRMLEFLQLTTNPVDMQLLGQEGRKYLLEAIAMNNGIDAEKLFSSSPMGQQLSQLNMQPVNQLSINETNPVNEQAQEVRQGNENPAPRSL